MKTERSRTERRRLERKMRRQQKPNHTSPIPTARKSNRTFFILVACLALVATTAVIASLGTPLKPAINKQSIAPTTLLTAPNQSIVHLDDGGNIYVTDNIITAFHSEYTRHRELLNLQYTVGSVDGTDYHPLLWRSVEMSLRKPDGSVAEVSATRPLWWFDTTKAKEGATVPLDIHEAGISGMATVHKITSLSDQRYEPPASGYNRVIGKIKHLNATVLDLTFQGAEDEPLGVTPNHPLWSEDRSDWVPAGELHLGEKVTTTNASSRLLRSQERPGKHTVYNIEVHRSHAYHVGKLGLMAHNTGLECERVFSVYEILRKRNIPGDPVDAFERTRQMMNSRTKWTQKLKSETVEGIVQDIERLKNKGELDNRLMALGADPAGFKAREVFVGRRFEMQKGKTLSRSNVADQDYFDEAGQAWDAFGPIPSKFFNWKDVSQAMKSHFLKQNINSVFDLAGLTPSQKKLMRDYAGSKPEWSGRFEFLDD